MLEEEGRSPNDGLTVTVPGLNCPVPVPVCMSPPPLSVNGPISSLCPFKSSNPETVNCNGNTDKNHAAAGAGVSHNIGMRTAHAVANCERAVLDGPASGFG